MADSNAGGRLCVTSPEEQALDHYRQRSGQPVGIRTGNGGHSHATVLRHNTCSEQGELASGRVTASSAETKHTVNVHLAGGTFMRAHEARARLDDTSFGLSSRQILSPLEVVAHVVGETVVVEALQDTCKSVLNTEKNGDGRPD